MGSLRSRAMNIWHAGGDGVYLFNAFDPASPVWRELGDPEVLAGLDKDYFPHGYWRVLLGNDIKDQERFIEVPLPPFPERPVEMKSGEGHTVVVNIGETRLGPSRKPVHKPEITLSVLVSDLASADALTVTLNGQELENGSFAHSWASYEVAPEGIQRGVNKVHVTNRNQFGETIPLRDVHVRINYPEPRKNQLN